MLACSRRSLGSYASLLSRGARAALLFFVVICLATGADAVPLIGTNGTALFKFDSSTPGTVTAVQVTGMASGDKLIGLDYRPANGQL